jgi:membrane protein
MKRSQAMKTLTGRVQAYLNQHRRLSAAMDLAKAVAAAQSHERISLSAAAVAFWAAIAVTPTLIAISTIFGKLVDPDVLDEAVQTLRGTAPDSFASLLASQLQTASGASASAVSWSLVLSLITVLWAVSSGIYAFLRAVRIAYGLDPQNYLDARARAFAGALVTVVVLGVMLLASAAGTAWASSLDEPWRALAFTIGIVVGLLIATGLLVLTFHAAAGSEGPTVHWPGAAFGAVGSLAVFIGFGIYLRFATSYQAMYGALASTVILSLVLYVATFVILIGAVANAHLAGISGSQAGRSRASVSPA